MDRLEEILSSIDKAQEDTLLLISDLNLSLKESTFLDTQIKQRNDANTFSIELLLLDHHGSGQDSAEAFTWYNLDVKRCATKILYDYACIHWDVPKDVSTWLAPFVKIVNAVDIWIMDEVENFEYGKVCMRLITETRELNRYMFKKEDLAYKFTLLKEAASMALVKDAPIKLDEKIHAMKKAFFLRTTNNTLDGLATAYVVEKIGQRKDELIMTYRGYTGIVTYALGNTSIIGNGILKAYPEIDFVLDLGPRGTMSIRADYKIDVSILAKELAQGGGHPNASGARLKPFREQYRYDKVREIIQKLFDEKEPKSAIPLKA